MKFKRNIVLMRMPKGTDMNKKKNENFTRK